MITVVRLILLGFFVLMCSKPVLALSKTEKCRLIFNSYTGYPAQYLIEKFGNPQKTYIEGNQKVFLYGSAYKAYQPGSSYTTGDIDSFGGFSASTTSSGGYYYTKYFWLKFFIDSNNNVTTWKWEGNDSKSYIKKYSNRAYVAPRYVLDLPKKNYYLFGYSYKDHKEGLLVAGVTPMSPAEKIGLKKGVVFRSINGKDITKLPYEFKAKLIEDSGSKLTFGVKEKGKIHEYTINKANVPALAYLEESQRKFLGFSKKLDDAIRQN